MKTKFIEKKILEYMKKYKIANTRNILDHLNIVTKHGTRMEVLGNVLSRLSKEKKLLRVFNNNKKIYAIWKYNINK